MKYFIDFEATQFSEEIISIGCKREDGETFYSLVQPIDSKITPFITNLTGITADMVKEAMSPDAVFELFYDWLLTDKEGVPDFFVWGDSDVDFLRHTFRRTTSIKARIAIGYVTGSIIDYSKQFCKKIKADNCSLIKAYNVLVDASTEQTHNALEDAMMLTKIYQFAENIPVTDLREKMAKAIVKKNNPKDNVLKAWNHCDLSSGMVCIVRKKIPTIAFNNLSDAATWLINNKIQEDQRDKVSHSNIQNKLFQAIANGKQYFGCSWKIIP